MQTKPAPCLVAFIAGLALLFAPTVGDGKDVKPAPAPAGTWVLIGTTRASRSPDHNALVIKGPFNAFRSLKLMASNSTLYVQRMDVTLENAAPYRISLLQNIPDGGESQPIDLPVYGPRNVLKIEYWYQSVGPGTGKASLSVFGMR